MYYVAGPIILTVIYRKGALTGGCHAVGKRSWPICNVKIAQKYEYLQTIIAKTPDSPHLQKIWIPIGLRRDMWR